MVSVIRGFNADPAKYRYFGNGIIPRPTDLGLIKESHQARFSAPQKLYINPMILSEGELELKLLAQQLEINAAAYPDVKGIYNAARNMIFNAVKEDLHRATISFGSVPDELKGIAKAIKKAKKKTTNYQRRTSIGGFDPFSDDQLVDISLICEAAQSNLDEQNQRYNQFANSNPLSTPNPFASSVQQAQTTLANCFADKNLFETLNDNLEKSAHNMTYGFLSPSDINTNTTAIVADKASKHKAVTQILSSFSPFISHSNLKLWTENGIMRQNVNAGEQPFNGSETSFAIGLSNTSAINRIGLDPGTITLIIGLAKVVIALVAQAISKSKKMKEEMSTNQQAKLTFQAFGTGAFDASKNDWEGADLLFTGGNGNSGNGTGDQGSQTPNNGGSNTPLILGGLGFLAFLASR